MALTELETARVRKTVGAFIERRRPPHQQREKLDLSYRVSGQSVEIFEVRPAFGGAAGFHLEEECEIHGVSRSLSMKFWTNRWSIQ